MRVAFRSMNPNEGNTMRILIATLAVLTAIAPASAISRYNAATMSCAKAKNIVRAEGAVLLNFRATYANVPRYGRFVTSDYYCASSERAEIVYIPTADTESCPVLECKLFDIDEDFGIWKRRR
jgi:hypothetical protein